MTKSHVIKFSAEDPLIEKWLENQKVKTKSIEAALKVVAKTYGTDDLLAALIDKALEEDGD